MIYRAVKRSRVRTCRPPPKLLGQCSTGADAHADARTRKTKHRTIRPSLAEDLHIFHAAQLLSPLTHPPCPHLDPCAPSSQQRRERCSCAYAPTGCLIMSKFAVETSIRMAQRLFQRLSAACGGTSKLRESLCPSQNATNGLLKLTSKLWQE